MFVTVAPRLNQVYQTRMKKLAIHVFLIFEASLVAHDIQHNDNQHNDTQHYDTQHNDTQHNDCLPGSTLG